MSSVQTPETGETLADLLDEIPSDLARPAFSHASGTLQERVARRGAVVDYAVVEETGPPHDRHFVIAARVKGREVGRGEGRTKKTAEQEAAAQGLAEFDGGGD